MPDGINLQRWYPVLSGGRARLGRRNAEGDRRFANSQSVYLARDVDLVFRLLVEQLAEARGSKDAGRGVKTDV